MSKTERPSGGYEPDCFDDIDWAEAGLPDYDDDDSREMEEDEC